MQKHTHAYTKSKFYMGQKTNDRYLCGFGTLTSPKVRMRDLNRTYLGQIGLPPVESPELHS